MLQLCQRDRWADLQEWDEAVGVLLQAAVPEGASLWMRRWQRQLQPDQPRLHGQKSEKRASFWERLGYTAAEGSNEALNRCCAECL